MADRHSEQGSGEELTRPPVSVLLCADGAATEGAPDYVTGSPALSRSERILFDNEVFSIARRSDPVQLVLAGEIDYSSIPYLAAALLDAAGGCAVLHVDLADVYFCDLAALRTIIGLDQHSQDLQLRRWARSVVLHNVPGHVEKVLRIVGWDATPGLTIDTGGPST